MFRYLNNFFSLVSANFIANIISVVTLPILVRKIGVELYGNWIYLISIISIFSILLNFGSDTIIIREISAKRIKAKKLLRHIIALRFLIFILIILLIFTYNFFLNADPESLFNKLFYIYTVPILLSHVLSNEGILNANELFRQSSILKLISQSIYAISIIFFINEPNDIYYAAIGSSVGVFISLSIGWNILHSKGYSMIPLFNLKESIKILKKSYYYLLSSLCSITYNRYGVIASKIFLTDYELGLYTAAIRLTEIILEFLYIIPKPLGPRIVLLIDQKKNYMKLVIISLKICILTYVPIAIGSFILKNELIPLVLGSSFYNTIPLIDLLIPTMIFCPISVFFSGLLVSFNKHSSYLFSVVIGAIISIISTTFLASVYGVYGITIGFTLSHFCIMIINYALIKKKIKNLIYDDNFYLIIQLLLLFIYAYIVIYMNSLFFKNIFLSIGFSILMYIPAMYFSLKKEFFIIEKYLKN